MAARCYLGIDFETLYASPPYQNGADGESDTLKNENGISFSANEKRNILHSRVDDEVDKLEDLTDEDMAEHGNGRDRANLFVSATIDEDLELSGYSTSAPQQKRIRLVNEVGRAKVQKAVRLKSYSSSA